MEIWSPVPRCFGNMAAGFIGFMTSGGSWGSHEKMVKLSTHSYRVLAPPEAYN